MISKLFGVTVRYANMSTKDYFTWSDEKLRNRPMLQKAAILIYHMES